MKAFPTRSSDGPDGLTAQHVWCSRQQLEIFLTDFVNILLFWESLTAVYRGYFRWEACLFAEEG